jgi:chemosensory pili system protein ChpB (putative protein-glutamate methylesterase)
VSEPLMETAPPRADRKPCVGVVATSDMRRHALKKLLLEGGFEACGIAPEQVPEYLADAQLSPAAWLLDTTDATVDDLLDRIVQGSNAPLLISDEDPPLPAAQFAEWRRRMLDKLEELMASAAAAPLAPQSAPQAVWVLVASTGGPAAVGEFIAALQPGLPIALVYAQHIDANFDKVLADAFARHRHYAINLGRGEQQLRSGSLLVVPADRQLRFLPFYRVVETSKPWQGPYQPVLDQVVAELARQYRQSCGVIVFTGLCDDGALGCRIAQTHGSEVWVQSPASCASPEMPNAALATGIVSRQGTPVELANALNTRYSR